MMDYLLSELRNTSRPKKKTQRIGRGPGSKRGKTSGRGSKGAGSRRGYQRRFGYEGGQVPLFRKLPIRGFTRGRFAKPKWAITLAQIERHFAEGDMVNSETLHAKGLVPRKALNSIKIIATGELSKKVQIEAHAYSEAAKNFLEGKGISFKVIG